MTTPTHRDLAGGRDPHVESFPENWPAADAQAEAVLGILAPHPDLPPGFTYAPGLEDMRVPVIYIDWDGRPVRPNDEQLRALAEQIVTAIRTASGPGPEVHDLRRRVQAIIDHDQSGADVIQAVELWLAEQGTPLGDEPAGTGDPDDRPASFGRFAEAHHRPPADWRAEP